MPVQFGRNAFISVAEETTYGSPSGTSSDYTDMRLISTTLQKTIERARKTNLNQGSAGFVRSTFDGFNVTGGNITIPLHYAGNGHILKAALGSVATTGSGPYTHKFLPDATPQPITIRLNRGAAQSGAASQEEFKGCVVSTCTISCAAGEEAVLSAEIISQDVSARSSSGSATFPASATSILHHQAGSLTYNSNAIKLRSFELVIDNKLERRNFLGQQITEEPTISDAREIRLTASADLEDNNYYNDYITTPTAVASNVTLGFTSGTNQFNFTLFNCILEEYSDNITTFGRIERTFTFLATVNGSDEGMNIDMINDNAAAI